MLLSFSFENYLSFKGKNRLSLIAGSIKEKPENVHQLHFTDDYKILKALGIYGANSSGKSNIIKGLSFMKSFVLNSSKETNATEKIPVQPFKLSSETENKSSVFEVFILIKTERYKYGFIVTDKLIEGEWLMKVVGKKEEKIFLRARQEFNINKKFQSDLKSKIDLLAELTRPNSLFLSVLSQFNMPLAQSITTWFNNVLIAHDTDHLALIDFSANLMEDVSYRKLFNDIIRNSGLGIESIEEKIKELSIRLNYSKEFLSSILSDEIGNYSVKTRHAKFDENLQKSNTVTFDLLENESLGTQKYFGLLGPILIALKDSRVLIIDEIDARLHTHLLERIIGLFNSTHQNPNGAQLLFTSHNTNVLKSKLRRDQMILVEKNEFGISSLDSLYAKQPKVRNDASFDRDYLEGKYGAIPFLSSQLNLFNPDHSTD